MGKIPSFPIHNTVLYNIFKNTRRQEPNLANQALISLVQSRNPVDKMSTENSGHCIAPSVFLQISLYEVSCHFHAFLKDNSCCLPCRQLTRVDLLYFDLNSSWQLARKSQNVLNFSRFQ